MQVGFIQGMIQSPVAVTFLGNHDVIIAEEYRVQRFDRCGRSLAVVGWYSLKPAGVAVTKDGLLAVTDKASQTVRFFHDDGRDVSPARRWPERLFGMPAGVAVVSSSGDIVVVDAERKMVTVHPSGIRPVSFVVPRCRIESDHFGIPTHIAVDNNGMMFVSDSQQSSVKVSCSFCIFFCQYYVTQTSCVCLISRESKSITILWPFVQDNPGEPVPEETFTHSHLS